MTRTAFLGPDTVALRAALAAVRRAPATSPVTFAFLAACVVLFVRMEVDGSSEDVDVLIRFGAAERGHVWAGEVWRLAAAAFLHVGVAHLAWNVVTMLGWCIPVERAVGTPRFTLLYLGAAITASATSLLVYGGVTAGASGAGYAMIAAHLVLARRRAGTWRSFLSDPSVGPVVFVSLLWTLGSASDPMIDHAGHLGGFAAGLAIAWASTAPAGASRGLRRLEWAVAALVVAIPTARSLAPREADRVAALELEVFDAIESDDLDAAARALARASDAGLSSPGLEYGRSFVLQLRGDIDGARAAEALARSPYPDASREGANAAKALLGLRLLTGEGMEPDPARGRRLLEEVCSDGVIEVCEVLEAQGVQSPAEE